MIRSCSFLTSPLSWKPSLHSAAASPGCLYRVLSVVIGLYTLGSQCSMGSMLEPGAFGKPQTRQLASVVRCDHQSRPCWISKCHLGQDFVSQGANIRVDP